MTAYEIIRKVAERSWWVNMHSHGCAVNGRDVTPAAGFGELEPPETRVEYGPCDCGWGPIARSINEFLTGPVQLELDLGLKKE